MIAPIKWQHQHHQSVQIPAHWRTIFGVIIFCPCWYLQVPKLKETSNIYTVCIQDSCQLDFKLTWILYKCWGCVRGSGSHLVLPLQHVQNVAHKWVLYLTGAERLNSAVHPQQDADQANSTYLQQDQQVHVRLPEHRWCLRHRELPGNQSRSGIH